MGSAGEKKHSLPHTIFSSVFLRFFLVLLFSGGTAAGEGTEAVQFAVAAAAAAAAVGVGGGVVAAATLA